MELLVVCDKSQTELKYIRVFHRSQPTLTKGWLPMHCRLGSVLVC